MVEPKTVREVAIDLASFKKGVDTQFNYIKWLLGMALTVLIGIAGGVAAIWFQIGDLKATSAATGRDIVALSDRIAKIEKVAFDISTAQIQSTTVLNRIDNRLSAAPPDQGPYAPLTFNSFEQQLIREYFKVLKAGGPPKYSLGDVVTGTSPIPSDFVAKMPKLVGTKVAYDPNGYVIFVGAGDRVVAIIGPS